MDQWMFLEDDSELISDLLLFSPSTAPPTAPPIPPPPPPTRFCYKFNECAVLDSFEKIILIGQSSTSQISIVTTVLAFASAAILFIVFCACRHHKRKMQSFLSYKRSSQLNHVVLGVGSGRGHDPDTLIHQNQNSNLPDMYGRYGSTLNKSTCITPSLVILERNRSTSTSSKEHLNPIYEEIEQYSDGKHFQMENYFVL